LVLIFRLRKQFAVSDAGSAASNQLQLQRGLVDRHGLQRELLDLDVAPVGPGRLCAALVLAVLPSLKASGQCFDAFIAGPITTTPSFGTDGPVNAMIAWAAPGQSTRLYIGGSFTKVGCVEALNIAAWDGARWYALGSGVDREVRSLAVWNGSLIAGGEFLQAGGVTAYRR
jgi:hypothetical protein